MPPRLPQQQGRSSRESTGSRGDDDHTDTLPYLEVRFSVAPRTSTGLVFGTDDNTCDVVLPNIKGMDISKRHFALTYKTQFADGWSRLILRDLGSRHGTIVVYNALGGQPRSDFDWILDGFDLPNATEAFIVQLHEKLRFRIVVARHDITSPAYANNVERFHQRAANPQDLLRGFGLQSGPETELNTGTHTPVRRSILLPLGWIGKGGFGVVSRHWNVSTGEEFACKQPVDREYNRSAWEKEIHIMRGTSHANIVRLCFSTALPSPLLYLEYMEFGNLEDQHSKANFSREECETILHQSTSALNYLHERSESITHGDLKPENILVQHRDPHCNPDGLRIKLSDFGLAKIGNTGCVSETYCPPEICASPSQQEYTKAADIWSLGVVILRFAYALPHPDSGIGRGWCENIVEEAQSWESGGLIDVLQRMLVIDAKARYSAADCWYEASRLVLSQDRSSTPTPASYAAGCGAAAAQPFSTGQEEEDQEALDILQYEPYLSQDIAEVLRDAPVSSLGWPSPSLEHHLKDLDIFSEDWGYIRSNSPPPASSKLISSPTRKTYPERSIADANQHPGTVVNIAQWEDEDVVQHAWTDSEQHEAAVPLWPIQMASAQPGLTPSNALIHPPQHMPHLTAVAGPAEGGRSAPSNPKDANGSSSAGDDSCPRPHPVHQGAEHAGPSHVAEGLPEGQEELPIRRRKNTSPEDKDVLEAAYQENPRPRKAARLRIMQRVSMNAKQVQYWFENRRKADRWRR
ncbi:Serine/threonine-protein kinase Chk2 [Cytospora mali]|uniref:non-specific serine/threonine protein kinase n=1 Tax=Cytospora mali TaxID=578113 RepID=A0A194WAJ0_CYTMA|nr:Serine/threonine-protein kinase Chk2 [Valsa mali]